MWLVIFHARAQMQVEYWINDNIENRQSFASTANEPLSVGSQLKILESQSFVNKITFRFRPDKNSLWSVPYTTFVRTTEMVKENNEVKGCRFWIDNDLENIIYTEFSSGEIPDVISKLAVTTAAVSRMHQVCLQFIDDRGLYSVPVEFTVFVTNQANGLDDMDYSLYSVYPNPIVNGFYLKANSEVIKIEIFDLKGALQKSFLSSESGNTHKKYDVSDLTSGMYILRLYTEKNMMEFKINITR